MNSDDFAAADKAATDPFSPSGGLDLFSGLSISGPSHSPDSQSPEIQQQNGGATTAASATPNETPVLSHGHNSGLDLLDLEPDADTNLSLLSNGGAIAPNSFVRKTACHDNGLATPEAGQHTLFLACRTSQSSVNSWTSFACIR